MTARKKTGPPFDPEVSSRRLVPARVDARDFAFALLLMRRCRAFGATINSASTEILANPKGVAASSGSSFVTLMDAVEVCDR